MKHFPSDIKFKYDWRKYQKRLLDELEGHLDDDHLHIIAPPGSGKTVLGLEVILRLNKPTLVLAPTIAIRNQWILKFCELFLQIKNKPEWISRDIKNPKFLTIITYQSLHSAMSNTNIIDESENEIQESKNSNSKKTLELLLAQNIKTIVVDEAHHLKNAWWKSLTEVKRSLTPTVVGLTATPPYDVSPNEWQRYIELNGPVDAEISVPELVIEKNLCPHQDFVYFSFPTPIENEKIYKLRSKIKTLFKEIQSDKTLIQALQNHPIFQNPNEQLEWIYSNLESYSSTLIFLNAVGIEITKEHLSIIGSRKFSIPSLNYEWIEKLLTFYLHQDPENFEQYKEHQENLVKKLKINGALERRSINFKNNQNINKSLNTSISKLKSIEQIVEFEHNQLRSDLRMVVLTDYIRSEYLVNDSKNDLQIKKIGVIPIFEQLRRSNDQIIKIGILTGSIIIIPTSALEAFKTEAKKFKIENISTSELSYDKDYLIINTTPKLKHDIVHIITQIFEQGEIEVLVGTKSLLGEGWDAPSINSLILASFVGSYVLSNQMRGRAIRTEKENIHKTSNIWHLVCIDQTSSDGGHDMQLLERRFKTFVGISFDENVNIENGIRRLHIPEKINTSEDIITLNDKMFSIAKERDLLIGNWRKALESGTTLIEEIKVPFTEEKKYKEVKTLHYNRTIKYLFGTLASAIITFIYIALEAFIELAIYIEDPEVIMISLMLVGSLGVAIFGRLAFVTFRAYIKYRDISKDIYQISVSLLKSLIKAGTIKTDYSNLLIIATVNENGEIYCHLEGGTTFEKSIFVKSLHEIIGIVDNPRYIIIRKSFFLDLISQKDYHSVPEIIGRKKQLAEFFKEQWSRNVGSSELVYTRTVKGRKILLKSRIHSLASEFEENPERVNRWK